MTDSQTESPNKTHTITISRPYKSIANFQDLLELEQITADGEGKVKYTIEEFRKSFAYFMQHGGILTCDGDFFHLPEGFDILSIKSSRTASKPYSLEVHGIKEVKFSDLNIQNNTIKHNKQSFLFRPKFYTKNRFQQNHIKPTTDAIYKAFAKYFDKFMLDKGIVIQDPSCRSIGGMIVKLVYQDIVSSLEP